MGVGESEISFSLDGTTFSLLGGERAIATPAREMCVKNGDMPPRWEEHRMRPMDQPRFGQRDYAVTRFSLADGEGEEADISFETVVYKDQQSAAGMLLATLRYMGFLKMSKVGIGDVGVMVEVVGQPKRRMRAILFVERNVFGLIMLSCAPDSTVSDAWMITMARLMASRMR